MKTLKITLPLQLYNNMSDEDKRDFDNLVNGFYDTLVSKYDGEVLVTIIEPTVNALGDMRKGREFVAVDGIILPAGYWMDWPEDHYPENYYELPVRVRMELECVEQFKWPLVDQFKGRLAELVRLIEL